MRRLPLILFLIPSLLLSSCYKDFEKFKDYFDDHVQKKPLIINGNFEWPIDFQNPNKFTGWEKGSEETGKGEKFTWDKTAGRNISGGVILESPTNQNDLYITQQISLDPKKIYRISAWVKTVGVTGRIGANICVYNSWIKSDDVKGTSDWTHISLELPQNKNTLTIACRLGFWAGNSTGKAYFDDVTIEEIEKYNEVGKYVALVIDKEDAIAVNKQTIKVWISNLDQAYLTYAELMDYIPYNGKLITVSSVDYYPGGLAVAGNPILWYKPYIKSELQSIQSTGTWSFAIMHELGHDFNPQAGANWVFNEEMFANFRMYYVVEKLNATIIQGKLYKGSNLQIYYSDDAGDSYKKTIAMGIARGHDGIMYTLIRIKNKIGWTPFMKTMKDLNNSQQNIGTGMMKFNLFLDKLSFYSNTDVRKTYLPGELETISKILK